MNIIFLIDQTADITEKVLSIILHFFMNSMIREEMR